MTIILFDSKVWAMSKDELEETSSYSTTSFIYEEDNESFASELERTW